MNNFLNSIKNFISGINTVEELYNIFSKERVENAVEYLINQEFPQYIKEYYDSLNINFIMVKSIPHFTVKDFNKIYSLKNFNQDLANRLNIKKLNLKDIQELILPYQFNIDQLLDTYYFDLYNQHKIVTFSTIDELKSIDDKPGDMQRSSEDFKVNSSLRDYAIAFIDKKLYIGKNGEHHADLARQFLKDKHIELINRRGKIIDRPDQFDLVNCVDKVEEIDAHINDKEIDLTNTPYMFGHIWEGIGFIDTVSSNLSFQQMAELIKLKLNLEKVYRHSYTSNTYPRLANIQNITNIDQLQLDSILDFTVKFNIKKFMEYIAYSKDDLSQISNDDVTYFNNLLTDALRFKMNKPINIRFDKDNILKLISKYSDINFKSIYDNIQKQRSIITTIPELAKYIDINELIYKLDVGLYNELKEIIIKYGYHKSIELLEHLDKKIILDYCIRSYVKPLIDKFVSLDVNLPRKDLEGLIPNFDYKLKHAIDHFKIEVRNKNRLAILLEDESFKNRFLKAISSILKKIYSKDSLINFFKVEGIELKYDQLMSVEQRDVLLFYENILIDKLTNLLKLDSQVVNHRYFRNDLLEAIMNSDESPTIFTKNMNAFILPFTKQKLNDLLKLDDKIGDTVDINIDDLDVMNREKAFIVLNGKLYIGKKADVHGKIISEFTNNFSFKRDKAQQDLSFDSMAYGHIVGKLAFLDELQILGNISLQEVVDILKDSHKFKKIYTIPLGKQVSRLAKLYKGMVK